MADKSKFEREIDELLEKTESPPNSQTGNDRGRGSHNRRSYEPFSPTVPKRPVASQSKRGLGAIKLDSGYLIIAGLIVLGIAVFGSFAKGPLAIVGFVLLVAGYVIGLRSGKRSGFSGGRFGRPRMRNPIQKNEPEVKYWRGRRIEDKPEPRPARGKIIDFGPPKDDEDPPKS